MRCNIFAIALIFALTANCSAAIVYDSEGFEAYANNSALVGQFGWEDNNPPNGSRFVVQGAVFNGGSRAVAVSADSETGAFVAPVVDFTPASGEIVVIEVDIARTIADFPFEPSSPGFAIDVVTDFFGTRIMGFGLGVNSNNNAIVPFVTRGDGSQNGLSEPLNFGVDSQQFVSFRAELDFDTDTFQLFANGAAVTTILPFVNEASMMRTADLQHESIVNGRDNGYFDNYRISTEAVPEPGSALGLLVGALGVAIRRRRK